MKHSFLISLFLFLSLISRATDLLIIEKDTFYLETYPLESLHLTYKPFGLTKENIQTNNLYPGYQAVWRISEGKLYLEKIFSLNNINQEENIAELLKKNSIHFQTKKNLIFAEWISMTYYAIEPYQKGLNSKIFLGGSFDEKYNAEKALLQFKKGIVTINKLHE